MTATHFWTLRYAALEDAKKEKSSEKEKDSSQTSERANSMKAPKENTNTEK